MSHNSKSPWVVRVRTHFVYVTSHNGKCSCQLYVLYVYQAKEAIKEAQRCDPGSIFTQFSVYKIAVLDNNVEKGI